MLPNLKYVALSDFRYELARFLRFSERAFARRRHYAHTVPVAPTHPRISRPPLGYGG